MASARRADFDRTTGAPQGQYKGDQIVWKLLREDAWMLRCAFVIFRCACRVEELGNLNISELVSRIRTSSVTLRDERRSNKGFAGLTQSDGQITDGQLQKIIVRAHKMPSIACAVSDRPLALFRGSVGYLPASSTNWTRAARKAEYWAQWWAITDGRAYELRDCT